MITIDMKELANELLKRFPIIINEDEILLDDPEDELEDYILDWISILTNDNELITENELETLREEIHPFIVVETAKRLRNVFNNFDSEDHDILKSHLKQYETEVEND